MKPLVAIGIPAIYFKGMAINSNTKKDIPSIVATVLKVFMLFSNKSDPYILVM